MGLFFWLATSNDEVTEFMYLEAELFLNLTTRMEVPLC